MRRLLLFPALLLLATCTTSEDFTPTTPGPGNTIPTIGGTYSSPTMWHFELALPGEPLLLDCSGSLTISNQIGDDFSGTFVILDDACGAAFPGNVANGVLRADGGVSFELTFSAANINFVTGAFGCTYISGDTLMTGTLVGNRLEAIARTEVDCTGVRAMQVMRLAGNR